MTFSTDWSSSGDLSLSLQTGPHQKNCSPNQEHLAAHMSLPYLRGGCEIACVDLLEVVVSENGTGVSVNLLPELAVVCAPLTVAGVGDCLVQHGVNTLGLGTGTFRIL